MIPPLNQRFFEVTFENPSRASEMIPGNEVDCALNALAQGLTVALSLSHHIVYQTSLGGSNLDRHCILSH